MDNNNLDAALCLINTSVRFMLLLILGVLLSFASLLIQRQQLCQSLAGEEVDTCPDPSSIRKLAGTITLWCAGFFFFLTLKSWQSSADAECATQRVTRMDLWASLLVLAASFIRLWALEIEGPSTSLGAESGAMLPQIAENILPA